MYQDADSGFNHGFPSGLFADPEGTLAKIDIEPACVDDPAAADGCSADPDASDSVRGTVFRLRIEPLAGGEFAGLHFEEPEGWSTHQTGAGYDLQGAVDLVFDARSPDGAEVQFGLGDGVIPFMVVPEAWTEIRIPLSSLFPQPDLTEVHLLFTVVTNDSHAPAGATVLCDRVRLEPAPTRQGGVLGFPLANETFGVAPRETEAPGRVPIPPDQLLRNVATTYESALVAQTLLARGLTEDLEAARTLAEALGYALAHDNSGDPLPVATDGSTGLHNAYESGELALLNGQGAGAGQAGEVRLSGFSAGDELCGPSGFCLVLDGATGGNNAFAMFALLVGYRETGQMSYLEDARTVGRWIVDLLADDSGTGFGGYYLGYPDEGVVPKDLITGKSIENNADVFAAFAALAEIEEELGDAAAATAWRARAEAAADFVLEMFDPASGCFHAGTVPAGSAPGPGIDPTGETRGDDVVNRFPFLDAQTFTTLALAWDPAYRNALDWRRPVQCMLDSGYDRTVTAAGTSFEGFNLVQAPTEGPDGVAWEFTAQAVSVMRFVDALYGERRFEAEADLYLAELRRARTEAPFGDGRGLVASTLDGGDALPPLEQCLSTPFQCVPERVGLAATTWAILAERDVNPFRQALPACLSAEILELSDQQVDTVAVFEACDTLSAGQGFGVVAPGDATFRAGRRIVLSDGFAVIQGARFRAVIDASLR
ncbi:MAG TPA: hypothetical protein VJG13_05885 [Thermoanaerobaculia bacterium]|nr:hypothetical protein [Thermoanaerobaculia bacterium]